MDDGYVIEAFDIGDRDNVDLLLDLIRQIDAHDSHPDPTDVIDLEQLFSDPKLDAAHDLVVARSNASVIGWIAAVHRPSTVRLVGVSLRGGVHGDHRGRGVGSALLAWGEARAREQMVDADPALPRWIAAEALENQDDTRRLLRRHGFEERRWFIDMKRSLDEVPTPTEPAGIQIVPWADNYSDAIRQVHAEAFADHWGSIPFDSASWAHILGLDSTRLDLSLVALDGEEVVAYSFNEAWPADADTRERVAWVGSLGTLRSHRQRGIAGSLLEHSHVRFAEAGFTHAMLDVDADSPSNASSIYLAHGYVPVYREVVAVKEYQAQT